MSRRQPAQPPMVELFADPVYHSFNSAAVGIVLRLVEYFWRTECRPFGRDDPTILALSRGHKATYVARREDIIGVFDRWEPVARAALERRRMGLDKLAIAGGVRHSRQRLQAAQKTHTPAEPRSEPRQLNPVGQATPAPERAKIWTD